MNEDETEAGSDRLSDKDFEAIERAEIRFGGYTVIGPGVQIMLDGRAISHPGE